MSLTNPNILIEIPFLLVIVCMATIILSSLGSGLMRYVAVKKSILMDIPNNRSSHDAPMPRGGGAPMALSAIISIALLGLIRAPLVPNNWVLAICFGGGLIAWIGWQDDKYNLSPQIRFTFHVIASIWAVFWLVPPETNFMFKFLAGFWVAWSINFYNFMDGIDGLAGAEAVFIGICAGYIAARVGTQPTLAINWVVACAALGFLFWNWPPAKIFMGDAGSGFLGYTFGCLAIGSGIGWNGGFYTHLVLLALFWGDATFTLVKRIFRGEKFWEAHRQHIYQKMIQRGYSHLEVTLLFILINMIFFVIAARFAGIGYL